MSNSGPDLSVSRLIVVNIEGKEYHFIVREHPIVGNLYRYLKMEKNMV